jgi:hypothetical protein
LPDLPDRLREGIRKQGSASLGIYVI